MIYVCDAPMGIGKTTAAINMMNEHQGDRRYLYITPLKSEVERIRESCAGFYEPDNGKFGTKLRSIKWLISQRKNIVSTHALFQSFDEECVDILTGGGYTLVMDEVTNVIEPVDIEENDLRMMLENYVRVEPDGKVVWTADGYSKKKNGVFEKYKNMAKTNTLYCYAGQMFMWVFPITIFSAFIDTFLLTYLFEGQTQCNYYDFYHQEYKNIYVAGGFPACNFTDEKTEYTLPNYKDLVTIVQDDRLNFIGNAEFTLSRTWYIRNKGNVNIKCIKDNLYNFFRNKTKATSSESMWTTFKEYKEGLQGGGYTKGFIPFNTRATNLYRHKTVLAYTTNTFMNPVVRNFFVNNGVSVNEDLFALSELLQWVFRSAIRDGGEIMLYIPSKRMRTLLESWLADTTR